MSKLESRILKALYGNNRGLAAKDLARKAGIDQKENAAFYSSLKTLTNIFAVMYKHGKYISAESLGLEKAEIVKVTNTFGFARPEKAGSRDVFIPGRLLMGSMPGDTVLIKQARGRGELPEGEVHSIITVSDKPFSGTVSISRDGYFIMPDKYVNTPIKIDRMSEKAAKNGDKVLAVLSRRGERHSQHMVKILEVFGDSSTAASCCKAILAENGIDTDFSDDVIALADEISASGIHPKEIAVRKDLRDETIFTIDGADTKDIDDAVSLKRTASGWELGVHIADVSYYVSHKSLLDNEAFTRGTSVYYADSVIPMLPPSLSNGICSLNPDEDRLAFSALINLDNNAEITDYTFEKTIIRSKVKGVYSEINDILAGSADENIKAKYAGLENTIADMNTLAAKLMQNRCDRGGMDIDSSESKIIIGSDGKACEIKERTRGISEQIIEEFMLTANEAAASLSLKLRLPFVYRIHESPDPEKIEALYEILDSLGISHEKSGAKITPASMSKILNSAKDTEFSPVINIMVLRSMAKAKYSYENMGHFGLALENYTHFTSPIRRYPDLIIHRILSAYVTGMRRDNIGKRFFKFSASAAAHSSAREVAAVTAERSCEDCYKAEYMEQFIGHDFDGIISSVTAFGVYVKLENTVEGLVRLSAFPSGEWFLSDNVTYTERVTGNKMRIGGKVKIKVSGVNISAGQIDMIFS